MKKIRIFYLTALFIVTALCFTLLFALLPASADEEPSEFDPRLDLNEDGVISIKDVNYLLNYLSGREQQEPTVEEILRAAYALPDNARLERDYTLTGKVTKINRAYSTVNKNVTVTITADGYESMPLVCSDMKNGEGVESGKGVEALKAGDVITVTGTIANKKGEIGFESGCTLDRLEPAGDEPVVNPETPAEILAAAEKLNYGAALEGKYTLSGVVVSVDSGYSGFRRYITVTIRVDGTDNLTIQCYHLKNGEHIRTGEGVEVLDVDCAVTVTGTIEKSTTGVVRFASGCTLDAVQIPGDASGLQNPVQIVNAAYALANGTSTDDEYQLTGVITEITEQYSAKNGVSLKMVVSGMTDKPILCTRLNAAGADSLKVGDTVIVCGKLTKIDGTVQFVSGSRLALPTEAVAVENARFETLDSFSDRMGLSYGLPSAGNVEVLVIPIGFTNSSYKNVKETLEIGLNGTAEQTGWQSLSSYYREVSYGKLNFHATITDIYQTNTRYNLRNGESGSEDYKYLVDALTYFKDRYDYTQFDQNGDGYLDCVYLVYLAPYMSNESQSDLWWAYTSEYLEDLRPGEEELQIDGVKLDWYMWFSFEFFNEAIYSDGWESSTLGVKVNAETVIHETGHALGLDDYYDYVDDGADYGGLGALNMMDCNQGDHDPFSKAILGWINPTVINSGSYERTISSFTTTGDAIFLSRSGYGSFFDEFYIICFYTPDGVNALKANKECGLYNQPGVVIYHVNSSMKSSVSGSAFDIYACNNGAAVDRLIKIVEADGRNDIDSGYYTDEDDLFLSGDSLMLRWNDGTLSNWTVTVTEIDENGAKITITG